jgi:hypothetical protein
MDSIQQQQEVGDFSAASSWCKRANLMMADKERPTEMVPRGCGREKRTNRK